MVSGSAAPWASSSIACVTCASTVTKMLFSVCSYMGTKARRMLAVGIPLLIVTSLVVSGVRERSSSIARTKRASVLAAVTNAVLAMSVLPAVFMSSTSDSISSLYACSYSSRSRLAGLVPAPKLKRTLRCILLPASRYAVTRSWMSPRRCCAQCCVYSPRPATTLSCCSDGAQNVAFVTKAHGGGNVSFLFTVWGDSSSSFASVCTHVAGASAVRLGFAVHRHRHSAAEVFDRHVDGEDRLVRSEQHAVVRHGARRRRDRLPLALGDFLL